MLNIPSALRTKLKNGSSVHKVLRIHFPNGELDDITNDKIIEESLSFTESACSSGKLKLGLAESSVLKFECVVPRSFKGLTIEATIEVENGASYYPIPLGVFVVDECKLNSNHITRSVVAYSAAGVNGNGAIGDLNSYYDRTILQPTFEETRRFIPAFNEQPYDSELKKWIKSMCSKSVDPYDTLTKITLNSYRKVAQGFTSPNYSVDILPTKTHTIYFKDPKGTATGTGRSASDFNDASSLYVYKSDLTGEEKRARIIDYLDRFDTDLAENGLIALNTLCNFEQIMFRRSSASGNSYKQYASNVKQEKEGYIYPYVRGLHTTATSYAGYTIVNVVEELDLIITERGTSRPSQTYHVYLGGFELYKVDDSEYSVADKIIITLPRKKVSASEYRTQFPEDFSLRELVRSYAELNGSFGFFDRVTGNLDFWDIAWRTGETIYTGQYETIECDPDEVEMFTSVHAVYTLSGTEEEYAYFITEEEDSNPYVMNDNYILKNGYLTASQVATITDSIGEKLSEYAYVPCNINLNGLPHLEACDFLYIVLWNGELIEIPVLRRTLSGIQALKDNVDVI